MIYARTHTHWRNSIWTYIKEGSCLKLTHRDIKQTYSYQRVSGGGINWEYGVNRCIQPRTKEINNKDLLYSSMQIDEKTVETVRDLIFLGSKITADGD